MSTALHSLSAGPSLRPMYFIIISLVNSSSALPSISYNHEKALREMQTLRLAVVRQSKKISSHRRPPSGGCGTAKILSAGDGHYLPLQTQFGEDWCTQFWVIVVTDPQTMPARLPLANTQTEPITIHCVAKLSVQRNYNQYYYNSYDSTRPTYRSHSWCGFCRIPGNDGSRCRGKNSRGQAADWDS